MRIALTTRIAIAVSVALMGLMLALGGIQPQPASAAAFTVTKTADTNDGLCNADCSLREAVVAANAAAGHDNISIPNGTYTLTGATGEDASASGDLDVTESVSFNGSGMTTTIINGGAIEDVIHVQPSASGINVTNLTIGNGHFGIRSSSGDVSLTHAAVFENGLTGIATSSGNVTLATSIVAGNGFGDGGDGITTESGNVTMTRSTVSANQDDAVETETGNITTTNSTISGNGSDGLFTEDGDITVNWSTVTLNESEGVQATESGLIFLYGALIADNTEDDCSQKAEDSDNSMDTDGTCDLGVGEVSNGTANLGPLQNNGGTTETHALLAGSDAIDAGGTSCPEDDQRGESRSDAACDIGAYEGVVSSATATPEGPPKTHTPAPTEPSAPTSTPVPATSVPTTSPPPNNRGGQGGVISPPDTGSGPQGGSSQSLLLVCAAMLALAGTFTLAAAREVRR